VKIAGWVSPMIALGARWLDDSVSGEQIRGLIRLRLPALCAWQKDLMDDEQRAYWEAVIVRTRRLVPDSGLLPAEGDYAPVPQVSHMPLPQARQWLDDYDEKADKRPFEIPAGSGAALETLLGGEAARLLPIFERLMRHLEVGRRDARWAPAIDKWVERYQLAAAFCHASRIWHDLRLLNTGMKLNDWSFPHARRESPGAGLALCLLALAEQEAACREMLIR
jgi:hypothetical protein